MMSTPTNHPNHAPEPLEGLLKEAVRAIRGAAPPAGFGATLLSEAAAWKQPVSRKPLAAPASRGPLIWLISSSIAASLFFLWLTAAPPRTRETATGPTRGLKRFELERKSIETFQHDKALDADSAALGAESQLRLDSQAGKLSESLKEKSQNLDDSPAFSAPPGDALDRTEMKQAEARRDFFRSDFDDATKRRAADATDKEANPASRFSKSMAAESKSGPPAPGAPSAPPSFGMRAPSPAKEEIREQEKRSGSPQSSGPEAKPASKSVPPGPRGGSAGGFGGGAIGGLGGMGPSGSGAPAKENATGAPSPAKKESAKSIAPAIASPEPERRKEQVPSGGDKDRMAASEKADSAEAPAVPDAGTILSGGIHRSTAEANKAATKSPMGATVAPRLTIAENGSKIFATGDADSLKLGEVTPWRGEHLLHMWSVTSESELRENASNSAIAQEELLKARPENARSEVLTEIGAGAFAVTPDGNTVVNSNGMLFDVSSKKVTRLEGMGKDIRALAISPDGKRLVSQHVANNFDCYYRLADLPSGENKVDLPNQWGYTFAVGFSPDNAALALMDREKFVREYRLSTGELLKSFAPPHLNSIRAIEYSPNGKLIASAGTRGETYLFNRDTGALLHSLKLRQTPEIDIIQGVTAMRFSPDSRFLAASGLSNLFFWSVETGEVVAQLEPGSGNAVHLRYSADGKKLTAVTGFLGARTADGKEGVKYPTTKEWDVPAEAR